METKPGVKTTEFWFSIVSGLFMAANATNVLDYIPNGWGAIGLAFITALYSVARGQAKQGVAYTPPPVR